MSNKQIGLLSSCLIVIGLVQISTAFGKDIGHGAKPNFVQGVITIEDIFNKTLDSCMAKSKASIRHDGKVIIDCDGESAQALYRFLSAPGASSDYARTLTLKGNSRNIKKEYQDNTDLKHEGAPPMTPDRVTTFKLEGGNLSCEETVFLKGSRHPNGEGTFAADSTTYSCSVGT